GEVTHATVHKEGEQPGGCGEQPGGPGRPPAGGASATGAGAITGDRHLLRGALPRDAEAAQRAEEEEGVHVRQGAELPRGMHVAGGGLAQLRLARPDAAAEGATGAATPPPEGAGDGGGAG